MRTSWISTELRWFLPVFSQFDQRYLIHEVDLSMYKWSFSRCQVYHEVQKWLKIISSRQIVTIESAGTTKNDITWKSLIFKKFNMGSLSLVLEFTILMEWLVVVKSCNETEIDEFYRMQSSIVSMNSNTYVIWLQIIICIPQRVQVLKQPYHLHTNLQNCFVWKMCLILSLFFL